MSEISLGQKLGYGLGHVLNDLCASMWFTYLLLFFQQVLSFNNNYAGVILLVGQVADGLSTTFVGGLSDKPETFWLCRRYGQKKSWHLVGLLCVLISFPFIFLPCIQCAESHQWAQTIYYGAFAIIFQFGWASMQISHLALIPILAKEQRERTGLTTIRYSMTVVCNITVFLVAWAFFGMSGNASLTSADSGSFRNIMLVVIGLGVIASIVFHLTVKEDLASDREIEAAYQGADSGDQSVRDFVQPMSITDWFKEPQFYLVGGVYMSTRLFVNLSQAYLPLYIQESLQLHSTYVAIIPLVMYTASFVTSFPVKYLNNKAGRKISFIFGTVVGFCACVWIYFVGGDEEGKADEFFKHYGIFFTAVMIGTAGSAVLITSLSLTAELIGNNTETAAFVYGAMSFTDKVSNGLAVMVIQNFIPCKDCPDANQWYYRDVLFFAVGMSAVMGLLFLAMLAPFKVGRRWRERQSERVVTETVVRFRSWLTTRNVAAQEEEEDERGEAAPLLAGDRLGTQYS